MKCESAPPLSATSGELAAVLAGFKRAVQVGVVVRDLDQSMRELTDLFGIGPFRIREGSVSGGGYQFCGQSANHSLRVAFTDLGTIELELVQPINGRSIWSDFLAEHGPGIHHIRFNVPNHELLSEYLLSKGIRKTQEGPGVREGSYWVNYDTERCLGFTVEILQPAPGTDGLRTPGTTETQHSDPT
jgi:methylmalonyl-CoA/ethylmalonyl-CoA epimerase